jgi:hypothetical protein
MISQSLWCNLFGNVGNSPIEVQEHVPPCNNDSAYRTTVTRYSGHIGLLRQTILEKSDIRKPHFCKYVQRQNNNIFYFSFAKDCKERETLRTTE